MGRPSKLTDKQWDEIKRRALNGEKPANLAREFKVSRATISARVSARVEKVKSVANQIVSAEQALGELPISEQFLTVSLASKLRAMSDSLAQAGMHGAATAHRLNALANSEVSKVDDANPMASLENLRNVGVLTKLANDSSSIALNLLAANKETVKKLNGDGEGDDPEKPRGVLVVPGLMADAGAWSQAAQAGSKGE
jgi:hypothetical protein